MKQFFLLAAITIAFTSQSQIKMPAPSPAQTIAQDFGLGQIEISYSRPGLKGRTAFGENSELAPLGKVWRTGANAVTKIKNTDVITFGGHKLDTGTYAIWTIPGEKEWTIIINKDYKNWGTQYVEADNLFQFTVPAEKIKRVVETFTIQFDNNKDESCYLYLIWGNTLVAIPITTNINDKIRTQVEAALNSDKVNANTYYTAANFYYTYDKDLNKALSNVTKAVNANQKNAAAFILKAKIEKDLGDKASAKTDAEKCASLGKEMKNDDYVRTAEELIKSL